MASRDTRSALGRPTPSWVARIVLGHRSNVLGHWHLALCDASPHFPAHALRRTRNDHGARRTRTHLTRPTTTRKASVRAREQAAMHVAPSVRGGECSCVRRMRQHLAACGARGTRASIGGLPTHPNYWAPPGSWGTCACALGSVTWTVAARAEDLRPPLLRADRHDGASAEQPRRLPRPEGRAKPSLSHEDSSLPGR